MIVTLFLTFAKIGLFTFGGGYAMLSMIEHICVSQKQWITHDDLAHVTVIAESTPGPVAVNCATFVGYRQKGLPGALAATLGVILPSFVIIFLISLFLDRFLEITWVASAFQHKLFFYIRNCIQRQHCVDRPVRHVGILTKKRFYAIIFA